MGILVGVRYNFYFMSFIFFFSLPMTRLTRDLVLPTSGHPFRIVGPRYCCRTPAYTYTHKYVYTCTYIYKRTPPELLAYTIYSSYAFVVIDNDRRRRHAHRENGRVQSAVRPSVGARRRNITRSDDRPSGRRTIENDDPVPTLRGDAAFVFFLPVRRVTAPLPF